MTTRTSRLLTEVERITIAHLIADHAASFCGQRGAIHFGKSDAVRYVTEGYVGKRITDVDWNILWRAVEDEVDAHPEVLDPITDAQAKERHEARAAAADVYDGLAADAFKAGDCPLAAALVDAAERECPDRGGFRTWDDLRGHISNRHEHEEN